MSSEEITTYEFVFQDGQRRAITVCLRPPRYDLIAETPSNRPSWTRLDFERCPNCTLPDTRADCPVATNLQPLNSAFSNRISFEAVEVTVRTVARTYLKNCPLQEAVGSLMGLIMATSGCPHLDKLRPMVITHLPFSTADQTTFRLVSMYLMAQFFRKRHGLAPDWDLGELASTFDAIRIVNQAFACRLRESQTRDANLNAIVRLDSQADLAWFSIAEEQWEQLEQVFTPYYQDPIPCTNAI